MLSTYARDRRNDMLDVGNDRGGGAIWKCEFPKILVIFQSDNSMAEIGQINGGN